MNIELTDQEVQFLLQLLDQVTIRGLENKVVVIQLMAKLSGRLVVPNEAEETK